MSDGDGNIPQAYPANTYASIRLLLMFFQLLLRLSQTLCEGAASCFGLLADGLATVQATTVPANAREAELLSRLAGLNPANAPRRQESNAQQSVVEEDVHEVGGSGVPAVGSQTGEWISTVKPH